MNLQFGTGKTGMVDNPEAHGSAADPRVGKLTSKDAAMLKKLAEEIGALDCMPAWMRAEIEAKTKPPNAKDQP